MGKKQKGLLQKIYWFAFYDPRSASVRYRGLYPLRYLHNQNGIAYRFIIPKRSFSGAIQFIRAWLSALLTPSQNVLIGIQKIHSSGPYAFMLKWLVRLKKKNTIYDTDDADYLRFPPKTIHHFMKNCRACTVGSETLLEYTKQWNGRVKQITSPVVPHQEFKTGRNELFTIGWIGDLGYNPSGTETYSHRTSLYQFIFPAIQALTFPVRLVILGVKVQQDKVDIYSYFNGHSHVTLEVPENIDWQNETAIYKRIAHFDVGLAPLMDHPFNVAKSAFKVKQYLSCGVPVLGSTVGENKQFIQHGINGFLCDSPEAYREGLEQLYSMKSTDYAQICMMARARIPTFSMKHYCASLLALHRSNTNGWIR